MKRSVSRAGNMYYRLLKLSVCWLFLCEQVHADRSDIKSAHKYQSSYEELVNQCVVDKGRAESPFSRLMTAVGSKQKRDSECRIQSWEKLKKWMSEDLTYSSDVQFRNIITETGSLINPDLSNIYQSAASSGQIDISGQKFVGDDDSRVEQLPKVQGYYNLHNK